MARVGFRAVVVSVVLSIDVVLAAATVSLVALSGAAQAADGGVTEVPADAPTATARLDRNEGRIGDRIALTVTTIAPTGVPTNLPTELDLGPFEVVSGDPVVEEKDLGDGRRSRSFRLDIAAYETGELSVPPIAVTYIGKDGRVLSRPTEPVPIKIASLIANEPDPQLKDAAPPVAVLEEDLTIVYIAGSVLMLLLGGVLAIWLRRRIRERAARRPAPPPRPAHEIALEKLDLLAQAGIGEQTDLRQLYFELSDIVREYLGARFGLLALEMTTEELVDELRRGTARGLVPGEIGGWLGACDLVKFAKWMPSPAEGRGALETAIRIVESTRPRPEPQSPTLPRDAAAGAGAGEATGEDARGA
jgi:hypothetical protein